MEDSIFVRLSVAKNLKGERLDGKEIIQIYETLCDKKGAVWYSTNVRHMGEESFNLFTNLIRIKVTVKIFFVISQKGGGSNKIDYEAEVLEIKTRANKLPSPDKELTPDDWKNCHDKLWIKITNLKSSKMNIDNFIVTSTGRSLSKTLKISQHPFGYISEI